MKIHIDKNGVSTYNEYKTPTGVLQQWDEYSWWLVIAILILLMWGLGIVLAGILVKGCV